MYKHTIEVTIDDSIVHRYSILEWEELLLNGGIIQRDELPLSYGRIAEILAEDYHRYGLACFNSTFGCAEPTGLDQIKETTNTTYTDNNGFTIGTRILPAASQSHTLIPAPTCAAPEEANTMQIGIGRY